jgi:hypothetical protein
MGKEVWHDPAFKVYRGLGNVVILLFCWGVDVLVWKRVRGFQYLYIYIINMCNMQQFLIVWYFVFSLPWYPSFSRIFLRLYITFLGHTNINKGWY